MDNSLYTAKTLIRERAEILPDEVTLLITDGSLDVTIFAVKEEFHLTHKQEVLLENEIILVLLFFLNLDDFAERISESLEIEKLTASKIASFIHDDLFYVIDDLFTMIYSSNEQNKTQQKESELHKLQDTFKQSSSNTPQTAPDPDKPSTTLPPQAPTPVQGMRTMEADMNRVHGYGAYRAQFPDESGEAEHTEEVIRSASQEDILKEKPTLTDMPTYQEGRKDV